MEHTTEYRTSGGLLVRRTATTIDEAELINLARELDGRRGGVLSSGVEYPGRYSRWNLGYVDPPLELIARGRRLEVTALNDRGQVLLPVIAAAVTPAGEVEVNGDDSITVFVPPADENFTEEERTRRPTVFTALRRITACFGGEVDGTSAADRHLGLYGVFGYDLAFQFEPVTLRHSRPAEQRDLVLHLPDRILVVDRKRETSRCYSYDFEVGDHSTEGLPRWIATTSGPARTGQAAVPSVPEPPTPGSFAAIVRQALERFRQGDLFEVTPSQVLYGACDSPAEFYESLRAHNPAPYEFFFNLGEGEHLVAASPEMYVRVSGDRVETCPIAGTIRRGQDPFEDASQIRTLLNSEKDEAELTMCTDVDRNDKSRVCIPGSVRVIGRRQIELYSRLIHTVDHIEGRLRPGFDAFDAFLTHMWAVTVTGAPKQWAMQFIEDHEDSPRGWYGAAAGFVGFDGSMNTGLTLRAARIRSGVAAVRVGATLLSDSDPDAEERETTLKAQALFDVLARTPAEPPATVVRPRADRRVLVVDHQDSFVLTLSDYFRQHGCEVTTMRYGFPESVLDELRPGLVVLSPGPGRPTDFDCATLLKALDTRAIPLFGVCLGLQAMVEYEGDDLSLLPDPAHGKSAEVRVHGGDLLAGVGEKFTAGRYHSLYAKPEQVKGFLVTATTEDASGQTVAMAIENPQRRRWAVQFHPESILTTSGEAGHRVIANLLSLVSSTTPTKAPAS